MVPVAIVQKQQSAHVFARRGTHLSNRGLEADKILEMFALLEQREHCFSQCHTCHSGATELALIEDIEPDVANSFYAGNTLSLCPFDTFSTPASFGRTKTALPMTVMSCVDALQLAHGVRWE